ncbi:Piwi domain-containing protein [Jimgerdemannia flammicorona]|uniref:Piwi domain-containing protein n=1 Tax=Jimgerdemannia flammicorona TaxID=994334 RepID=A0A433QWI5_9FUNG|nr:Piwi domain-containing protein [Jimgerdemannia flammicorona]
MSTENVKRPGLGCLGREINIRSNFFEVQSLPSADIYHYDVTILNDVTPLMKIPPSLNRRIWQQFEDEKLNARVLGRFRPIYDGRKNAYSPKALPFDENDAAVFDVVLPEDGDAPLSEISPKKFKINIRKVGDIIMAELPEFLEAKLGLTDNCLNAIMVLDVLIRHKPSMLYAPVGRSFFTDRRKGWLPNGSEVWQGYHQSARPAVGKMMINVDVSATVFYEEIPLIDMVAKILNYNRRDDLRDGFGEEWGKVEKAIKSLRITVDHRGDNFRRKFQIFKLTKTTPDKTFFETGDTGVRQDVASYFRKTYNRRLNFPMLPCVVVQKNNYLPIEVCHVVKGQRCLRKLNRAQTKEMINFTCQPPDMRANLIKEGIDLLNYRENDYLKHFGLTVGTEMAIVKARVLETPTLSYHSSSRDVVPDGGAWNLRNTKVATGAVLGSWAVIHFRDPRSRRSPTIRQLEVFIREMVQIFHTTGLNVVNREPPIRQVSHNGNIEEILKEGWFEAARTAKAQPQLLMCVLPDTDVNLYAQIKRVTDTVIGVSSQCVQAVHTFEPKKQYCANVCLKVNLKLGGMNSFLNRDQIPFIAEQPTILFGADVTHPAPGAVNKPSIAAVCGSMDSRASRYSASIRVQEGRVEIISDLAEMVVEILKTFYQQCGQKPRRILFYRDGVSERQFQIVREEEIRAVRGMCHQSSHAFSIFLLCRRHLRVLDLLSLLIFRCTFTPRRSRLNFVYDAAACTSLDPNYNPTITFVIVQKRHHARFFPMRKQDADRTGNCLPGTVVETTITHPFEFDFCEPLPICTFILNYEFSMECTSRPCHYHVLHDENNFTPDSLQDLTYKLCYLYGRATRAVSIVPPGTFHTTNFHESEADTSTEVSDQEAQNRAIASYRQVKPDLRKVMYFM